MAGNKRISELPAAASVADADLIEIVSGGVNQQATAAQIRSGIDHGGLSGLTDDDHSQYLLADGTRALTANWDAGSFEIRAQTFQSDVATGTAPLIVASTTVVTNLNADLLDGQHASEFAGADHDHTGTGDGGKLTAAVHDSYDQFENVASEQAAAVNVARIYAKDHQGVAGQSRIHIQGEAGDPVALGNGTFSVPKPVATTGASQTGRTLFLESSDAVASTDTPGAAEGGGITVTAGDAARNTSGNADGGAISFQTGAGIGTGVQGTWSVSCGGFEISCDYAQIGDSGTASVELNVGSGGTIAIGRNTATVSTTTIQGTVNFSASQTVTFLNGFGIRDTSAAFNVRFVCTSTTALTAERTLTIDVDNGSRTLKMQGNLTVSATATITGTETTASSTITDNRIVRGDGGSRGVQQSGITIDDSDNVTGVAQITAVTGQITGNLTVDGDLLVSGSTVTHDVDNILIEDPLIKLAKSNTATHVVDIGIYGVYDPSGALDLYSGLFFDATDSKWKLFAALQVEPTTTVNTGGAGYTAATLVVGGLEGVTSIDATTEATIETALENNALDWTAAHTHTVAGLVKTLTNSSDAASVQVAIAQGDRATPASNDEAYISLQLSNGGGTQTEIARLTWVETVITGGSESGQLVFSVMTLGALTAELRLDGTSLSPVTSGGLQLGTVGLRYSGLHLTSGGIINWADGEVSMNGATDTLTIAGATLITAGTSCAVACGTVELGHASDTTLAREAAGQVTIEGNRVYSAKADQWAALTEKTDPAAADLLLVEDSAASGAKKKVQVSNLAIDVLKVAYPVGALYLSTLSTNPATLLGFGTWSAFGAGRVLVSLDSGDTDFDTAEETGGAKTHTLASSAMPAHTHDIQSRSVSAGGATAANDAGASGVMTTTSTGGGGSHSIVQPYIVVYMWKRTA